MVGYGGKDLQKRKVLSWQLSFNIFCPHGAQQQTRRQSMGHGMRATSVIRDSILYAAAAVADAADDVSVSRGNDGRACDVTADR